MDWFCWFPVKQQLNPNQPGSHHVTSSIFDSQFVLICPFPNGYAVDVYTCMYIVYTCMYTHTHSTPLCTHQPVRPSALRSLDGVLSFFEQESFAFSRMLTSNFLPRPQFLSRKSIERLLYIYNIAGLLKKSPVISIWFFWFCLSVSAWSQGDRQFCHLCLAWWRA